MLLICEIKNCIQRIVFTYVVCSKKYIWRKKNSTSHHITFLNNQSQETSVSCLQKVPDILATEAIGFSVKKSKMKTNTQKIPHQPTACILYTDLYLQ